MVRTSALGFPRIGKNRDLKKAVESFWKKKISQEELLMKAKEIMQSNWLMQQKNNIDYIASNDFSYYDHILDMSCVLGVIPERYKTALSDKTELDLYFAMARGYQVDAVDLKPMEMTKWFDTNYHYIVPEFIQTQKFSLTSQKLFDEYLAAKELGVTTRPVILGPVTYLLLGKTMGEFNRFDLLPQLLGVYKEIFKKFSEIGVEWIQIDEPYLVTDLDNDSKQAYDLAYKEIAKMRSEFKVKYILTTYFETVAENIDIVSKIDFDGLHLDLVRGKDQYQEVIKAIPKDKILSLGVIDGRNVWIANLDKIEKDILNPIIDLRGGNENIIISSSCSLIHSPIDVSGEDKLNPEVKSWLSFACQKLEELDMLKESLQGRRNDKFQDNIKCNESRSTSSIIIRSEVKERVSAIKESDYIRKSLFVERIKLQNEIFKLPKFPTTTIGSYPQTKEVRQNRLKYKKGTISEEEYNKFLKEETIRTIKLQEEIGLDVLVHGEFERNDMVEYFGEQLEGFAFTKNGWVQSYGSRCVKPPIIFGDVSREKAMTVEWSSYAQAQTSHIMKGMLTGPVTILQWSFVRDDQPRSDTCKQIALAIRDEVLDLEKAGIKIIQIDEAALREGMPIQKSKQLDYLDWAVGCFRLSANGVEDKTQIHTHMCYSEFNEIIDHISKMDADVISIESSRSDMELLEIFKNFNYPNQIGPGVYDIHSPRVPEVDEMNSLIENAMSVLDIDQLWVNPDCGLKTRDWPETIESLRNMVSSTRKVREVKGL